MYMYIQVHACHRLRNKKNTIIRFVNRKSADIALHNTTFGKEDLQLN